MMNNPPQAPVVAACASSGNKKKDKKNNNKKKSKKQRREEHQRTEQQNEPTATSSDDTSLIEVKFFFAHDNCVTLDKIYRQQETIINRQWLRSYLYCSLRENQRNYAILFSPVFMKFDSTDEAYHLPSHVNELYFGWISTVFLKGSNQVKFQPGDFKEYYFRSNNPTASFEAITARIQATRLYKDFLFIDERTRKSMDLLIYKENPLEEITIQIIKKRDNYSNLGILQLQEYMDFSLSMSPQEEMIVKVERGAIRRYFSESSLLTKMTMTRTEDPSPSSTLLERMDNFRKRIVETNKTDEWNSLVQATTDNLNRLRRGFPSKMNKAARRLIVDQIIPSVCDFMKVSFNVGDELNDGEIGWGLVDFQFFPSGQSDLLSFLMANVVVEDIDELDTPMELMERRNEYPAAEEKEDQAWAWKYASLLKGKPIISSSSCVSSSFSLADFDPAEDAYSFSTPRYSDYDRLVLKIEGKDLLDDSSLAQFAAPLYDSMKSRDLTAARGVLTTGTCWRFFSLKEVKAGGKPLLTFEGQCSFKSLQTSMEHQLSSSRSERAVDLNEIENLLTTLAASF